MTQEDKGREIVWRPEIRVDGVRPGWLGVGLCKAFVESNDIFGGWTEDYEDRLETDPAGWKWVNENGSPRITRIRLPADHPHYAAQEPRTAPNGGEVGEEVVERMIALVRRVSEMDWSIGPDENALQIEAFEIVRLVERDPVARLKAFVAKVGRWPEGTTPPVSWHAEARTLEKEAGR